MTAAPTPGLSALSNLHRSLELSPSRKVEGGSSDSASTVLLSMDTRARSLKPACEDLGPGVNYKYMFDTLAVSPLS